MLEKQKKESGKKQMRADADDVIPVWTARISKDGVVQRADVPGQFPYLNGTELEEGMSLDDFLDPDLARNVRACIERMRDTHSVESFEHKVEADHDQRCYEGRVVDVEGDELLLILQDVTSRKQAETALLRSREQLRNLAGHVESVREQERKRIAREVHDVLGQALTALRIDVASIQKTLPGEDEDMHDRLGLLNASIGSIIQKVRRIAADLRPGVLDDLGIVAALEWQTEEFATRTGLACSFYSTDDHLELDNDRSTALFRVFQEILTNVARHADASAIQVSLRYRDDELVLRVKDNGRGIRQEEISDMRSLGLVGMRERLLPWEGQVRFEGMPDHGTTVTVILPDKKLESAA